MKVIRDNNSHTIIIIIIIIIFMSNTKLRQVLLAMLVLEAHFSLWCKRASEHMRYIRYGVIQTLITTCLFFIYVSAVVNDVGADVKRNLTYGCRLLLAAVKKITRNSASEREHQRKEQLPMT